jgi:hypothetical protein
VTLVLGTARTTGKASAKFRSGREPRADLRRRRPRGAPGRVRRPGRRADTLAPPGETEADRAQEDRSGARGSPGSDGGWWSRARHRANLARRDPSPHWASRVASCSVPMCRAPYPGERSRGHRSVTPSDPAAFPVWLAGRRSRLSFRGLLGLHACRGPSACRPAPWRADVPRASASRLPFSPPR